MVWKAEGTAGTGIENTAAEALVAAVTRQRQVTARILGKRMAILLRDLDLEDSSLRILP
jgi:hypothetical protein